MVPEKYTNTHLKKILSFSESQVYKFSQVALPRSPLHLVPARGDRASLAFQHDKANSNRSTTGPNVPHADGSEDTRLGSGLSTPLNSTHTQTYSKVAQQHHLINNAPTVVGATKGTKPPLITGVNLDGYIRRGLAFCTIMERLWYSG